VFFPDPLSSARATYGDPGFIDADDADSPELSAQRVLVTLPDLSFDGVAYALAGPWAVAVDLRPPDRGPYVHDSPSLVFERSEPMFEAVNAYYHIDRFMRYVNDTLGVVVRPYQYEGGVRFDPHGSLASTAAYLPASGVILFGEGNVDKAEDADIILHELGHGIQDWITGGDIALGGVLGGTADYWANSYSRSFGRWHPTDEPYHWIGHWVSHNEFGGGRVTDYPGRYPDDLTGADHVDGQILATALMAIWDAIGRGATDCLVLAALAASTSGDDQEDFARAVVQADRDLFSGEHLGVVVPILQDRGYRVAPTYEDPGLTPEAPFALGAPFPNPASGWIRVRVSGAASGRIRVAVRDGLGRLVSEVYAGAIHGGEERTLVVDGSRWAAGLYWVEATDGGTTLRRPLSVLR